MALPKAWSYIRSNAAIIFLGLGQSCFEGAMYAFVFVWTPALQVGRSCVISVGLMYTDFSSQRTQIHRREEKMWALS